MIYAELEESHFCDAFLGTIWIPLCPFERSGVRLAWSN